MSAPPPAPSDYPYDFFISFTKTDHDWAVWIAWQLEEAGYKTFLQPWDFRPGDNFMLKMDEGSAKADRTIALLSPEYLESYYTRIEWAAAVRRDRLLLIRVKKAEVDGILGPSVYIDLLGKNATDARAALLAGVKKGRAKPSTAPPFPTELRPPEPAFPGGALPAIWHIRRERNPHLTGRDEIRKLLRDKLLTAPSSSAAKAIPTQIIAGVGGIGKTALATDYAYEFASHYDVVWELPCEELSAARAALAELAVRLGVERDAVTSPHAWESAQQWLEDHGRWLLLCDNAVSYKSLAPVLPRKSSSGGGGGHIIVTLRSPDWRKLEVEPLSLSPLTPEDGSRFLLHRTGRPPAEEAVDARAISQELGGLPLALELAGAYVAKTAVSFASYREKLDQAPLRALEPVARTLGISLEKLPPPAVRLLERLAFLAPNAIPRSFLDGWEEEAAEPAAADIADLDDAIGKLREYSLLSVEPGDGSLLGIYGLLQEIVRSGIADAAVCASVLRHMHGRFTYDRDKVKTWEPSRALYEHAVSAALHAADRGVEADKTCRLLNRAGAFAWSRHADAGEALPLLRRALAIDEKNFGADHQEVAEDLNYIGYILLAQSDLDGALTHARRALAIGEMRFGPDHPEVATYLNNVGTILLAQGELDDALTHTRRALAIYAKNFGPDHPDLPRSLNNIGQILQEQGDLDGALTHARRALAIFEKNPGPDDLNVAASLNNIGTMLREQGDLDGALPYIRRALATYEKIFGRDHPSIAASLNNIGQILHAQGDLDGALDHTRRALAIDQKRIGADHPTVATRLNNIAQIMKAQGDLKGALPLARRAFVILNKVLGPNHPNTKAAAINLALIERRLRRG